METSVIPGVLLHAVGGLAAATCFVPQKGAAKWSFQTYFLLMCLFSWFIMPIVVACLTVPELGTVISETPTSAIISCTALGALYGFGGMAFAMAIQYIGYSLTYSIAIGISAVVGTLIPQLLAGTLVSDYAKPGGVIVLAGFAVSILGVAACGRAGFLKEQEIGTEGHDDDGHTFRKFDMGKGLTLVLVAGVLSGIFGLSLAQGAPMDKLAAEYGAGHFQGNAKFIFAMGGAFLTNLIWWGIVHLRQGTYKEYVKAPEGGKLPLYWLMGIIGGILWYLQFLFYGLGHVQMSDFGFISWGIHMAMLIFFSFGIGIIFREWHGCSKRVMLSIGAGLLILIASFSTITYGSWVGERSSNGDSTSVQGH